MANLFRVRAAQGEQTIAFPGGGATFPARFRGRATLSCAACGARRCPAAEAAPPSGLLARDDAGRVTLDAGACLFAPEEEVGVPGCGVEFTADYRLASRTREGLRSADGAVELAAALDERARGLFGRSLRLRAVSAGSCGGCEAELVALGNVVFDLARFGVQFVASPRHADGIVVTGVVNANMRGALERTYAAVPDPRLVIVVGACAVSGGPFASGSREPGGIGSLLPVDLWIPGCPPHPLTLLDGLLRLLGRV